MPIGLQALDAANLLGYLAALGAFRTLSLARPEETSRMAWADRCGWWMPVIHGPFKDEQELVKALAAQRADRQAA